MSRLTLFVLILTISVPSCSKEEEQSTNFDSSLQEYFKQFEHEASLRNIDVDLEASEISGTISDIEEHNVAGQCFFHSQSSNHIVIDQEFWNSASHLLREMVVFHELGHCYLGRGHKETQSNEGICLSIMRSGLNGCFDNYNTATRDQYIDELFAH